MLSSSPLILKCHYCSSQIWSSSQCYSLKHWLTRNKIEVKTQLYFRENITNYAASKDWNGFPYAWHRRLLTVLELPGDTHWSRCMTHVCRRQCAVILPLWFCCKTNSFSLQRSSAGRAESTLVLDCLSHIRKAILPLPTLLSREFKVASYSISS